MTWRFFGVLAIVMFGLEVVGTGIVSGNVVIELIGRAVIIGLVLYLEDS